MRSKLCIAAAFLMLGAAAASAALAWVDPPFVEGGGWGQRFSESDAGIFDFMAIELLPGSVSQFRGTGFDNFSLDPESDPPWSAVGTAALANASGGAVDPLYFDILFTGAATQGADFNLYAWSGNTFLEGAHAVYAEHDAGWSWTITALGPFGDENPAPVRDDYSLVPAPGAALLGAIGLGLVGWVKRRL